MQLKVGIDLVNLPRFKSKIAKRHLDLNKIFSHTELKRKELEHLAGIFAAKEATIKALSLKPGSWLKIEVSQTKKGEPFLRLAPDLQKKIQSQSLSIAHDQNYAIAVVVVTLND